MVNILLVPTKLAIDILTNTLTDAWVSATWSQFLVLSEDS